MLKGLLKVSEVLLPESEASKFAIHEVSGVNTYASEGLAALMMSCKMQSNVQFMSNGEWNMHELLISLLNLSGNAKVYISSYAMNETAVRSLAMMKDKGLIKFLYCIIDSRSDVRSAGSLQLLLSISDFICLAPCHAKVTAIDGDQEQLTILGSANYTENNRYETGIILKGSASVEFHKQWIIKAFKKHGAFDPY
jgi:hypothetical protein